jgi:hypothetical protein
MIDMASVYAERFKTNPQALQAAVMGQSPDPKLDPYTALNALKLVKEANMMEMAGKAQQPTSAPSIVAENMAPNPMQQGLGAMVPGAMGQAPQGMPPQGQAPAPQAPPMQAASGGLAGMYTPDEDYATGGIVAFQAGGETEEDYQRETSDTGYSDAQGRRIDAEGNLMEDTDAGTGNATAQLNAILMKQLASMQKRGARKTDPAEQKALFEEFLARETKNAGPDISKEEIARGAQEDADRGKRRKSGEAMALLSAAGAVLKGRNLAEGASNALPAYAGAMNEVDRADQAMRSANAKMQFALKDAQRKERAGNIRAANASMENYRKFQQDENKAEFDKENAIANLAAKGITGNRTTGKGAGSGPKYQEQILQNNVDYFKSTLKPKPNEAPEAFDARVRKMASDETARALKTSFSTGEIGTVNAETRLAPTIQRIDADVINKLQEFKDGDRAYRAAKRKNDTTEADRLLTLEENRLRAAYQTPAAAPAKSSAAPAATPKPTTTSKAVSMADVRATVTSSGRTEQEVIDALKAKGYTIK